MKSRDGGVRRNETKRIGILFSKLKGVKPLVG